MNTAVNILINPIYSIICTSICQISILVHIKPCQTEHGCSSTVASTNYCLSSDYCDLIQIRYAECTGDWVVVLEDDEDPLRG